MPARTSYSTVNRKRAPSRLMRVRLGSQVFGAKAASAAGWSTEAVEAREQAREEERRRLARELHDELGQALTGFKMDLAWLELRLQAPSSEDLAESRTKVNALLQRVEQSIHALGAIVTDLRPESLDQLGLVAAIEWQAESFARRAGVRCRFTTTTDVIELDRGRATSVFRMFQEMLTNVARHANASRISVSLRQKADRLLLTVRDNGRGVSLRDVVAPQSWGLLGMRERALLLGGTLEITSARRRGTAVSVSVPLANRRAAARSHEDGRSGHD
jgi:signal transduction histidine kinase